MDDFVFNFNNEVRLLYPDARIGILIIKDVDNTADSTLLKERKEEVEDSLRKKFENFTRKDLDSYSTVKPYTEYYNLFSTTYHVRLQLESILSGKAIPMISPLVTSMFVAELQNQLLTAGHDLDLCETPFEVCVAQGNEIYTLMNGQTRTLKPKDLFIKDNKEIISSIMYGPDQRTKVTPKTRNAIYTVYSPFGIEESRIMDHLKEIADFVKITNSKATIDLLKVYHA